MEQGRRKFLTAAAAVPLIPVAALVPAKAPDAMRMTSFVGDRGPELRGDVYHINVNVIPNRRT